MKTCNVDGCNNPIWSGGACKNHAPRALLNKMRSTLKGSGLKKKINSTNHSPLDRATKTKFFMSIWSERPHYCEHCSKWLGHEPRTYMFDHLLEKSKYPELRLEKDNILLVCLACHDLKTRGIISEKYQEKINFAITKFNVS